jgi:hypothetical protein
MLLALRFRRGTSKGANRMTKTRTKQTLTHSLITPKIYFLHGLRVMLDSDLAVLYGVSTKNLNKAVKRNTNRFPSDFMFQLNSSETKNLRFQSGTSSSSARDTTRNFMPSSRPFAKMLEAPIPPKRRIGFHPRLDPTKHTAIGTIAKPNPMILSRLIIHNLIPIP